MPWGAAIGAAGSIAGGALSKNAAKSAGSQQAAAQQQALDFQKGVYQTGFDQLAPYYQTGVNALGSVSQFYGLPGAPGGAGGAGGGNALDAYKAYMQTPFYQFPLQQGIQARDQSAAQRGLTLSGGQLNALQQYGQNYGASNFGNYIAGLTSLAGLGQSAAGTLLQGGNQAGTNVGQSASYIGNARATGTIGGQNAINNALGKLTPLGSAIGDWLNSGSSNAPGTSGGFNQGWDLVNSDGSVVTPPIPPDTVG